MSALDRNPENFDFLNPQGFRFVIKKLPNVNFFLQKCSIPNIELTNTSYPNPFTKIPIHGDHIEYNHLDIVFKVDEDLTNYIELYNWIRGLGYPETLEEHAELAKHTRTSGLGIYSDASVIITTNIKNANIEVTFRDVHPIALGELVFDVTQHNIDYITCSARFAYTLFGITNA